MGTIVNNRMPQSLAKIYLHLVFSSKYRERLISDELGSVLHAYMGGILNDLGCRPIKINTEPDHAQRYWNLAER